MKNNPTGPYRDIASELEENSNVVLVKSCERESGSGVDFNNKWTKIMHYDFYVAPRNGLYTAEELNKFMMGLLPHSTPEKVKTFAHIRNDLYEEDVPYPGSLRIGWLDFSRENLENKTFKELPYWDRERIHQNQKVLIRFENNATIYLFPDQEVAKDFISEKNKLQYYTRTRDLLDGIVVSYVYLEKIKPGLISDLEKIGMPGK